MTLPDKPVVISCGEPAGIGPEVAAGAWAMLRDDIPMAWVGDPRHLPAGTPFEEIATLSEAAMVCPRALPVLAQSFAHPATPGSPDAANAQGVIDAIERCVGLVQSGEASALCTAPINKKALIEGAGFAYPGHTEYLGALAGGSGRAVMMLASEALRVVPVTIHIALKDVPATLTPELLRSTIDITHTDLQKRFGIAKPRIAIAGLNPHAGEGGTMGREETDWIAALVDELAAGGINIAGPMPADTMFHAAARAGYDVAICMYHDQALIPIKTLDFDRGVNVTLGLPFIRTSPDHGTAFDIAGRGIASPVSMSEAIKLAHRMAGSS
ncbi:4-hydroxythreonine-4-phosphate dehydrogenase PdxA [Roseobacter ponti]|uniref:4-hydroxythreonine-4-phosphate dehydrogenase n=1 Tax=Roseobacter ponti TaxID=1891787 RepID=A0A858ST66_9RHOB|nr:4-hydroxythreonine-4-phosphate dehydrogenase PdxA [Roseobacter ponti]QJF51002.1 4-hydroxythreonine-4-phosphate dehydrogenase PdxA [Roseobacter ponti]